jgi:coenzyme F420 biosynthesis associated uncharacterized protein
VSDGTLVDWGLAERIAGTVARPPAMSAPDQSPLDADAVGAACDEALEAARAYTGLDARAVPRPELIGRREWTRAGLHTLREATGEIEARVAGQLTLPGPLGRAARTVAGAAAAAEAGVAVGYAARRVLGQFDMALAGPERPARLLFVGPNLAAVRAELQAEPRPFLLWIAAHEVTHALQFGGIPWLAGHVRAQVGEVLELATRDLDLRRLARRLLGSDPRRLVRSTLRGELFRVLADAEQRAAFDRLQATMSVIEGHAEHVAEACAELLDPRVAGLQRAAEERRRERGGLGEAIGRMVGMDLKLRQYQLGKAFCDGVVEGGGTEGLRTMWSSPESLPSPDELERPRDWLERVTTGSPAAA